FLRARRSDQPRQPNGAVARKAAQAGLGQAQLDPRLADAKIARQCNFQAAAERGTVDRRDRGHRHARKAAKHHVLEQYLLLTGILPQLLEFPDVTPGTECSGVAAVKYQAANLRPFRDFPENTVEVTEHLLVDEVERTAVQAELGDRTNKTQCNERLRIARRRASIINDCRHASAFVLAPVKRPQAQALRS